MADGNDTNAGDISEWRSIVTLVVFVITNIVVLFPFHVPFYVPRILSNSIIRTLVGLRAISLPPGHAVDSGNPAGVGRHFKRLDVPLNFITAPLIADLFLLAISAIGRKEVHDGTIGADHINPLDIMVFFITLAYIAISIDASGLIRWLAFKVLQWGGKIGHKLFFYLYAFFFGLGSFIGNDPIILSGTAFLAYMTRVSKNIRHPKAWIHSQFAVANIASAILVSSNPTNLVLAGAFDIKFITYTANMIVPVIITAIVLFPFLLYIVFANEDLIPSSIEMHVLPEESRGKDPVNPNIPHARGHVDEQAEDVTDNQQTTLLSLEEIMNPFLDRNGAAFGAIIMATTLITLLALNAASQSSGEHPVFWVTLPAAFVMFCWDVAFGWHHRKETRDIARKGRRRVEQARAERERKRRIAKQAEEAEEQAHCSGSGAESTSPGDSIRTGNVKAGTSRPDLDGGLQPIPKVLVCGDSPQLRSKPTPEFSPSASHQPRDDQPWTIEKGVIELSSATSESPTEQQRRRQRQQKDASFDLETDDKQPQRATLVSLSKKAFQWLQETFPTVVAVIMHLPFALVPFAFTMFVLVQALVTKGWVTIFARGWDHWVERTGTVGAIGGMGFLSVVLCNFAGTNIGTTILLSRVIQQWYKIHQIADQPITDRTFWATVYSMAIGVNYGAFSTAFSASLAGLLWRDILARKHIKVKALDFARVNFPIIAISMAVGCSVLVAEVYIMRDKSPYKSSKL